MFQFRIHLELQSLIHTYSSVRYVINACVKAPSEIFLNEKTASCSALRFVQVIEALFHVHPPTAFQWF